MKSPERWIAWIAAALAVAAVYLALSASRELSALRRDLSVLKQRTESVDRAQKRVEEELAALGTDVELYFIDETPTAMRLAPEKRRIITTDLPAGVMQALIKGPRPGSPLRPSLPGDTVLNGVKIRAGTAVVDLGGGVTRLNLGSEGEAALVGSIVKTMTSLPGVQKVQILIDGAVVESLAGHVDISVPLSPDLF